MTPRTLDDLADAVRALEQASPPKPTSLRLPEAMHRATALAVELGMDASLTAATVHALTERVRGFLRQQALAEHVARFPEDRPSLAAVALRRIRGTGHAAERRPDLVTRVARQVERRDPRWLETALDATVERVLDHVELLLDESELAGSGAA